MNSTPQHHRTLATATEVAASIDKLAISVLADHAQTPLFVALLRGAAPFASHLMQAIVRQSPDYNPELDYMMVSTYGRDRLAGKPSVVTDLAPDTVIANRTVIILDDVLDKGVTAHFVTDLLLSKGASSVKLAVLVDKQTPRVHPITPDYFCLESPDVWLVGMGMDDATTAPEAYRWSDAIYILD